MTVTTPAASTEAPVTFDDIHWTPFFSGCAVPSLYVPVALMGWAEHGECGEPRRGEDVASARVIS